MMSDLYTVYTHPQNGHWGFTPLALDGEVRTAAVDREGRVSVGSLAAIKLAPVLQQLLRAGYEKLGQPKYLSLKPGPGVLEGGFVSQHPELAADLDGELLFFVVVPPGADMTQVVAVWRDRLEGLGGDMRVREQRLLLCSHASSYVPVNTADVHAALLAAQWARQDKLVLVSNIGDLPLQGPAEQGDDWRNALAAWFRQDHIDRALVDLGWAAKKAAGLVDLQPAAHAPAESNEWLALAQKAAF
jgi:hypothetical protein